MSYLARPEIRERKRETERLWARKKRTTREYREVFNKWYSKRRLDPVYLANVSRKNKLAASHTRGCSLSLEALFPLLSPAGRRRLAFEIVNQSSGRSWCWINPNLDDLVYQYTEEAA